MPDKRKRATIHDIASRIGVSTATVSRVLSNADYPVKESVRKKIREVAEELNYRPNVFSRILKGGVNKVVGIIVPSITNPYYAQLVSDVEALCIAAEYAPIICSSYNSSQLEQNHLEMLLGQQVAGILLSTINSNAAFVKKLEKPPVPLVLFDQPVEGFRGSSVAFNFHNGGYMATRYLLDKGHARIAFASQSTDRASRKMIYEGYKAALRDEGVRFSSSRVFTAAETSDSTLGTRDYHYGQILARKMLAAPYLPDAVIASNDMLAIGILNTLAQNGVTVPGDVSLIGFDDISFSAMISPALTTIRQETEKTAQLAVNILLRLIDDPSRTQLTEAVEPELIERESVRNIHPKVRRRA